MANNRIDKINVGGADYDIGSTNFVFDTYAEYQAAYSAGNIPVGSVVYIKEGSIDGTITALQVVYNNGTVKGALDEINNDLSKPTILTRMISATGINVPVGKSVSPSFNRNNFPVIDGYTVFGIAYSHNNTSTFLVPVEGFKQIFDETTSVTLAVRNVSSEPLSNITVRAVLFYQKN